MKIITTIAIAFMLVSQPLAAKECKTSYFFDSKPKIGLNEISKLTTKIETHSVGNNILVVHFFDEEDQPLKTGLHGIALVYSEMVFCVLVSKTWGDHQISHFHFGDRILIA